MNYWSRKADSSETQMDGLRELLRQGSFWGNIWQKEQEMYTNARRENLAVRTIHGPDAGVCCVVADQQEGRWMARGTRRGEGRKHLSLEIVESEAYGGALMALTLSFWSLYYGLKSSHFCWCRVVFCLPKNVYVWEGDLSAFSLFFSVAPGSDELIVYHTFQIQFPNYRLAW